jgi:16S rRNA (uracil1498-N3)-methyltransferase
MPSRETLVRRRFFVEQFADGKARLAGEAGHHLGRVLRAEPGQVYELSDGHSLCLAEVARVDRDSVDFRIIAPIAVREPAWRASLLLAVVKFDRFEWALEKAVELGAESITPLAADRCEKGLLAAAPKRAERWRRILLESAQQARCVRVPTLRPLTGAREAFASQLNLERAHLGILLSERGGAAPVRQVLSESAGQIARLREAGATSGLEISLAVGPEGGWTDGEFEAASTAGFRETALGGNILRTETAVAAGLAAAHLYFDP